jgi:hypothetical protein
MQVVFEVEKSQNERPRHKSRSFFFENGRESRGNVKLGKIGGISLSISGITYQISVVAEGGGVIFAEIGISNTFIGRTRQFCRG